MSERFYAIIDMAYTKAKYSGLAASWLRWELEMMNVRLAEPKDADIILVTVSSQQKAKSVRHRTRHLRRAGKSIVVGGAGGYGPAIFDGTADVVCVGEGRRFIRTLVIEGEGHAKRLPEAWVPGDTRPVIPNADFPWDMPPVLYPDGKYRVFVARGCKHKCLFCQTGFEQSYNKTVSPHKAIAQCNALHAQGKKFELVTNDAGADDIVQHVNGGALLASYRFSYLRSMPVRRLPTVVRIGVEGVSERLRRAVGKPIKTGDLVELIHRLFSSGKTVKLYFIAGLPFESGADWEEIDELIKGIGRAPKGICHMTFHSFIPQPAAPLSVIPLDDVYWETEEAACRRFFSGSLFTRRVNWVKPAQYKTRLENAILSMAATERELRRGWWHQDNPNWRVKYQAPPWKMRHLAACYARKMGRPDAIPEGVVMRP